MEDIVRIFKSPEGDEYHITLSEDYGVLSHDVLKSLGNARVVGIELRRLSGRHVTRQGVFTAIEEAIAEALLQNDDVIICYYCDFITPIPNTKKNNIPPQEYRSRLFDAMFQRYVKQHSIDNVRLSVVEINGLNEIYYFHVIYREYHSVLAAMIGGDLKEGFSK